MLHRKWLLILLLTTLLGSIFPILLFADSCPCHDDPDEPCVRQQRTLEWIEFPETVTYTGEEEDSVYYDRVDDVDEGVWVIIETVPGGSCYECAQTYVLYCPEERLKETNTGYRIEPSFPADDIVFDMTECSPATRYTVRTAIIGADEDYSNAWARVANVLTNPGLILDSSRGNAPADQVWSVRISLDCLDFLVARLRGNNDNTLIMGPVETEIGNSIVSTDPDNPGIVRFGWSASEGEVDADLACSKAEAAQPTQAERYQKEHTLTTAKQVAAGAPQGYSYKKAGAPGVPKNAVSMATSVSSVTKPGAGGTSSKFSSVIVWIRFADDSDYVYWEEIKEIYDKSGKLVSRTTDRGDSSSRIGSSRAHVRGDLTDESRSRWIYTLWGGSPSTPFIVPSQLGEGEYDEIELITPAGTTLDLSAFTPSSSGINAKEAITIHADNIALAPGASLEDFMNPSPAVLPGVNRMHIVAPEAASVASGWNTVGIVVVNLSGSADLFTVRWEDENGWVYPGKRDLFLPPGGASLVEIPIVVAGSTEGASNLSLHVSAESLGTASRTVELLMSTQPEEGIPEEVISCTEQIGTASGTYYKKNGHRRYWVPVSRRLKFFRDELAAYRHCSKLGPCVKIVESWLKTAELKDQRELADVFWHAFERANR